MKTFPTLYKRSSKGKISEWTILASEGEDDASYTTKFGYVDGAKQMTTVRVANGKNLGKKNATTAYEQACSEAEAKWTKQLDKGYAATVQNAEAVSDSRLSPMLAQSYDKHPDKIKWPCYWQPKSDGCRALAYRNEHGHVVLQSRQGKIFHALPHLNTELEKLIPKDSNIVLDGELYVHGEEFQELIHLIKRDEPHFDSVKIEYYNYDMYKPDAPDLGFADRLLILRNMWLRLIPSDKIKPVTTALIHNQDEMQIAKDWAKQNAYEGIMLRNAEAPYKLGYRSYDLQKVKEFQDFEFEIVGTVENKGKQEGECSIVCKTAEGAEFKTKPEGSSAQRAWYWDHRDEIIGKKLTVRFFSWTTSEQPVPRFPIGVAIRDYE